MIDSWVPSVLGIFVSKFGQKMGPVDVCRSFFVCGPIVVPAIDDPLVEYRRFGYLRCIGSSATDLAL